jgi:hypothetical protein
MKGVCDTHGSINQVALWSPAKAVLESTALVANEEEGVGG